MPLGAEGADGVAGVVPIATARAASAASSAADGAGANMEVTTGCAAGRTPPRVNARGLASGGAEEAGKPTRSAAVAAGGGCEEFAETKR